MPKSYQEFPNRGPIPYTSLAAPVDFFPPIGWVQVSSVGSGALVVKDESGTTQSYTGLVAGQTIYGPFKELTSMTLGGILAGDGTQAPVLPLNAAGQPPARMGAAGAITAATTAMVNLADLTFSVAAGQKIEGTLFLWANNATGTNGLKFDLGGGTATFTSVEFGFAGTPTGATVGTAISTAYQTAITCTAVTTTDTCYSIHYAGVVNAGGTLIPRFATNASTTTATVEVNSTASLATTFN